jgi:ring-1,2-phenylacetyl-CoA epoxidase subunit PaaE
MTAPALAPSRHSLHSLRVASLRRLTEDAVAITFDLPDELRDVFRFAPGQHVALVRSAGGDELRRSYSICSPLGGPLCVAVKRLPDGLFSTYAHTELRAGDVLDVLPPAGRFTIELDPAHARHYAAIAAGSGITPVISIIASVLATEPESRCTLIYGNRSVSTIMFLEELEDLKNRYPTRFQLFHVLSREPQETELAEGRLEGGKLERFLDSVIPESVVDSWLLCGPFGMVAAAGAILRDRGVPAARIHRELFHAEDAAPPEPTERPDEATATATGAAVAVVLDGRRTDLRVPHHGPSILEAALAERPDAPYACKGGVCGTCRCRVVEGEVRMDHAYALEDDEIEAGVRLACQSHPVSDEVVLDFDAV